MAMSAGMTNAATIALRLRECFGRDCRGHHRDSSGILCVDDAGQPGRVVGVPISISTMSSSSTGTASTT